MNMANLPNSPAAGVALSLSLACAAASQASAAPQQTRAAAPRPNVIVLLADDMRAGTIRALGHPELITPNLDALAEAGVAFTRAYNMGGLTGAVCMPSRAMLMTGRTMFGLDGNGQTINKQHTLLGEVFAKNGYATHGIGKWHNGTASFNRSFAGGAEILFGGMTYNQFEIPLAHYDKTGKYDKFEWARDRRQVCDHVYSNRHSAEIFADAAVDFIKSNEAASRPFFMYVAFTTPHDPRQVPQKYYAMYDGKDAAKLPKNFLPEHPFDNGHMTGRDERLLGWPRGKRAVRAEIRDYYATISHLDAQVGRIIEALKKSGQYENTIIVFSADNGLAVGQHGLMGKQSLYEHSIGIPMIWAGPGIAKNAKSEARCYLMDVYPTLCEKLGFTIPSSVQTESFAKTLANPARAHRGGMYFAFRQFQRAYSDGKYKLIEYNVKNTRTTQLFEITADPLEMENLAGKPEYAGKVKTMRDHLLAARPAGDEKMDFWKGFAF
ncbi:arylsulfatase A-like enzyme [Ereboglobus sp. PH5-5]|uniref:sulfatase-like hydrolase/transferase n=1 Tax=Ereboglobus sp. PH5-5 TaxID=2940529 RepID=UPI0024061982|nr:sulfatase-like hydrolase/transferase [Ereboglobus sp. PH5-5]MDF9832563.1 arylsulfatase A-like enzyme [Ereboglobus sp. PH5-5]